MDTPNVEPVNNGEQIAPAEEQAAPITEATPQMPEKKSKKWLYVGGVVLVAVVLAFVFVGKSSLYKGDAGGAKEFKSKKNIPPDIVDVFTENKKNDAAVGGTTPPIDVSDAVVVTAKTDADEAGEVGSEESKPVEGDTDGEEDATIDASDNPAFAGAVEAAKKLAADAEGAKKTESSSKAVGDIDKSRMSADDASKTAKLLKQSDVAKVVDGKTEDGKTDNEESDLGILMQRYKAATNATIAQKNRISALRESIAISKNAEYVSETQKNDILNHLAAAETQLGSADIELQKAQSAIDSREAEKANVNVADAEGYIAKSGQSITDAEFIFNTAITGKNEKKTDTDMSIDGSDEETTTKTEALAIVTDTDDEVDADSGVTDTTTSTTSTTASTVSEADQRLADVQRYARTLADSLNEAQRKLADAQNAADKAKREKELEDLQKELDAVKKQIADGAAASAASGGSAASGSDSSSASASATASSGSSGTGSSSSGSAGGTSTGGSNAQYRCPTNFEYNAVQNACVRKSGVSALTIEDIISGALEEASVSASANQQMVAAAEGASGASASSGTSGSSAQQASASASGSALHGAYIRGETGPGILLYPLALMGANGLVMLRRKYRKQK